MGTAERREREREQRARSIIDAAETLFFGKGFEQTTIDEVAEQAELSKGTIYLYFTGKEDLYHAVILRGLNILYDLFQSAIGPARTGLENIAAVGDAYYQFHSDHPDYFQAMLHFEGPKLQPENTDEHPQIKQCEQVGDRIFQLLGEVVSQGVRDGSMRADLDPLKTALVLWGHATGIMQIVGAKGAAIEAISPFNSEQLIAYSFEMIRHSLRSNHDPQQGETDET